MVQEAFLEGLGDWDVLKSRKLDRRLKREHELQICERWSSNLCRCIKLAEDGGECADCCDVVEHSTGVPEGQVGPSNDVTKGDVASGVDAVPNSSILTIS